MKRFSAKLLFQFLVLVDRKPGLMRLVEERIISLKAIGARSALKRARSYGSKCESDFLNNDGNTVRIEFVGVRELIELGLEADDCEVWYEIRTMRQPMEKKKLLIPEESQLSAFRNLANKDRKRG